MAGIVDAPLVKSVSAAVTVQEAERRARLSVTVTGPIGALIWVPGAPEPRLALAGTDSVNAPDVTVYVTAVLGSSAATAGPAGSGREQRLRPRQIGFVRAR